MINKIQKPVYELFIETENCEFILKLNDFVLYEQDDLGPMRFAYPINDNLDKKNILEIVYKGDMATFEFSLTVKDSGQSSAESAVKILSVTKNKLDIVSTSKGKYSMFDGAFLLSNGRTFDVEVDEHKESAKNELKTLTKSFQLMDLGYNIPWHNSIDLSGFELKRLHVDLFEFYKTLWFDLNSHNVPRVQQKLSSRTATYASAFYMSISDAWKSTELENVLVNPIYRLGTLLEYEKTELQFAANNRLVRLVGSESSQDIIFFVNSEDDYPYFYEFWFGQIAGKWLILK